MQIMIGIVVKLRDPLFHVFILPYMREATQRTGVENNDFCADDLARDAVVHSDFACTFRKCQPNLLRYMRSKLRQCKFDLDIFLRQKRSAHGVLLRMSEYILYWGYTVKETPEVSMVARSKIAMEYNVCVAKSLACIARPACEYIN